MAGLDQVLLLALYGFFLNLHLLPHPTQFWPTPKTIRSTSGIWRFIIKRTMLGLPWHEICAKAQ